MEPKPDIENQEYEYGSKVEGQRTSLIYYSQRQPTPIPHVKHLFNPE